MPVLKTCAVPAGITGPGYSGLRFRLRGTRDICINIYADSNASGSIGRFISSRPALSNGDRFWRQKTFQRFWFTNGGMRMSVMAGRSGAILSCQIMSISFVQQSWMPRRCQRSCRCGSSGPVNRWRVSSTFPETFGRRNSSTTFCDRVRATARSGITSEKTRCVLDSSQVLINGHGKARSSR